MHEDQRSKVHTEKKNREIKRGGNEFLRERKVGQEHLEFFFMRDLFHRIVGDDANNDNAHEAYESEVPGDVEDIVRNF
eukprot:scaffold55267_cov35-Tisochrysis_lutea.AAC.2